MSSGLKQLLYWMILKVDRISHRTHEEMMDAKICNDMHVGLDAWKQDPRSPDYDWELVQTRLHQLQRVRETTQSQSAMIFALRTSLGRNLGDIGNPKVTRWCSSMLTRRMLMHILVQ